MIKSLSVKDVATFDSTGIDISELKKVCFIYGANGSGKTTISNFIQSPEDDKFKECNIVWSNNVQLDRLVYNKNFREKNFGRGSIDGVFTLGQATKEDIEQIEKKQKEREGLKEKQENNTKTLSSKKDELKKATNNFTEKVWDKIYQTYKDDFKEAFLGLRNNKEKFKNEIINVFRENPTNNIPAFEELREDAALLLGEPPTSMEEIPLVNFENLGAIEDKNIWAKAIIGKADIEISKLIKTLKNGDWVNSGRNYIREDDVCPFCQQQTITSEFRQQLEDFFGETYKNDINELEKSKKEYLFLFEPIIKQIIGIEENEKTKDTKLDLELFKEKKKALIACLTTNREKLTNKTNEPSRKIELEKTDSQAVEINNLIKEANESIKEHNRKVTNYENEKVKLIENIWAYFVSSHSDIINNFISKERNIKNEIKNIEKKLTELQRDCNSLEQQIQKANKNVTSVQPSVDAINNTLKSYGYSNFEIAPSPKNQYHIKREDGPIAEETLSEGEVTFITFLYFLQLAKGSKNAGDISNDRVLIIDDPISSLDSNILFLVSSLIKELIKEVKKDKGYIKQVIILTHNVYFHKEVSYSRKAKKGKENNPYFWILRKNESKTTIECYEDQNPIQNSYELLWKELKNNDNTSLQTIQNVMRRIIEHYFKILGKYVDDDLVNAFENEHDKKICRSLISWINDGSHSILDDLYVENQTNTVENYREVFKRIFEKAGHIEHYNMMMKVSDF